MSKVYWVGGAPAVAQVSSVGVTGYDATTTYTISVGGTNGAPTVSFSVIAAGSANATATALAAAWNASTHSYCSGVTALASTSTVSFTADSAGVPFVITKSVSGGTGTLGSVTAVTASAGPNDWSTAGNWSGGAIPVNGDSVYIQAAVAVPILWGLAQSGVTPALLVIEQANSQSMQVGLFSGKFRAGATYDTTVPEYRQDYLAIGAAIVRVGENYAGGNAQGSALVKLDMGTTSAQIFVYNTGTETDGVAACYLKNTNAASTLEVYDGDVAVCWERPADTGQFSEIDVFGGDVLLGAGLTLATADILNGAAVLKCLPTTLKIESPATVTMGNAATGTITTLQKRGELLSSGVAFAVTNFSG